MRYSSRQFGLVCAEKIKNYLDDGKFKQANNCPKFLINLRYSREIAASGNVVLHEMIR